MKRIAVAAMLLTIMSGSAFAGELSALGKAYKEMQFINLKAAASQKDMTNYIFKFALEKNDSESMLEAFKFEYKNKEEINRLSSEYRDLTEKVIKAFGKFPKWWIEQQKPFTELDERRQAEHERLMDEISKKYKAKK